MPSQLGLRSNELMEHEIIKLYPSLRLRAPDPRQSQRVLRHEHLVQLRLCAASALEEARPPPGLLVQPRGAAQEPPREVSGQRVLRLVLDLFKEKKSNVQVYSRVTP